MARLPPASSTRSPAIRFRAQIEAAVADGVALEDMTLQLTLSDTNHLVRDNTVPLADISYAGGVMRFLGVRVEKGGVPNSALNRRPG